MPEKRRTIICKECGKEGPHGAHGLCRNCYNRGFYRGKPHKSPTIVCRDCGRERPHASSGLCDACVHRLARQQNPEKFQERDKARWDARRERENLRRMEYYRTHKETHLAKAHTYHQEHLEQIHAQQAEYNRSGRRPPPDKEQMRIRCQRRRTRVAGLPATLTKDQWEAIKVAYDHKCAYCGKKMQRLTQDHVIPVSKGGGYTPDNIVPACRFCNSSKHDRPPVKIPAIRLLL